MLKRITKREAKKLFSEGKVVHLCPCKLCPGGFWHPDIPVSGRYNMEDAEQYRNHPTLWKGSLAETAWLLMYSRWSSYNCSWETGYYAHYYEKV